VSGYAEQAWPLHASGIGSPLPIPHAAKTPPPAGFTGRNGVDPSGADVHAWGEDRGGDNIACRLADGVLGIDVDAYAPKNGAASLVALEARLGPLPASVVLTSRDDGISGIRLYRVPAGRSWVENVDHLLGRDSHIDVIQRGHRYAMWIGSTHGETGAAYRMDDLRTGEIAVEGVKVDDLPELPPEWVEALQPAQDAAADAFSAPATSSGNPHEGPIPVGSRDTSLRDYAALVRRKGLNEREAEALMRQRWQDVEQPAGDEFPLSAALAKVASAYRNLAANAEPEAGDESAGAIEWGAFLEVDDTEPEWLAGAFVEEAQQVALVGAGKVGKSLFSLDWAAAVAGGRPFLGDAAREPLDVLYVDQENGHRDLRRRVRALGLAPSDLARLHYLSFPVYPPLDTEAGGAALMADVQRFGARVVFLDTISRMISGNENDSETWLALYRCTLKPLKAAEVAVIRLDHTGKDAEKGARGSSAKTQDVDHVWELRAEPKDRLRLRRTFTRTGLGVDDISLRREGTSGEVGTTAHVRTTVAFDPLEVDEITLAVRRLDEANVPPGLGRDVLKRIAVEKRLGITFGNDKWAEVVRRRKGAAS
jgi:hypothetical protein